MDAAFAVLKKTAFFLAFALLVAMPRLAQADAPTFTSPAANQQFQLGVGSIEIPVSGSDDTNKPISYQVVVTYAGGDPHWLAIGGDTGTTGTACNGGTNTYQTPGNLSAGVSCAAGSLSSGSHTATIKLNSTNSYTPSPTVTFTVTYTPGGASVAALTATPSTLTGTNQLTAVSGALAEANVTLSTTSTAVIGFSTTSSAGWLTVQPAANGSTSASTPATLSFTASSAGLSPGSYTGYATVFYGTNQTLTIGVSFVVTATAVNFAPNTLAWTYESSSLSPSGAQTITLTTPNSDAYTARVTYPAGSTATNWLQINGSSTAYNLTNGSSISVSLANFSTLTVGQYTGTITVADPLVPSDTTSLTVTLTVSAATSTLSVSPSPVGLSSADGYEQLVTVTSSVAGALSVATSSTNNWLSASPTTGSVAANVPFYLTVTANTTASGSGVYSGTLTVTVGTLTQQVTVNLNAGTTTGVTSSGVVAPTSLSLLGVSGGTAVSQQVVFAGSGTFEISSAVTYSANSGSVAWLTSSSLYGSLTATGTKVTLRASPGNLSPGTYTATLPVSLTGTGSSNPSLSLAVTFVVSSGEVLAASPTTVLFHNGTAALSSTVALSATGSTAIPVTVTVDQAWLTAQLQSGATETPASILVSATTAGMTNGLYSGNILVTSSASSTLTIPVVVVVTGVSNPTGLTPSPTALTFSAALGAGSPASQSVAISATTAGTSFTAAASGTTSTGINWLSINPSGSLTTNQTIVASVSIAGLSAGTYAGNIVLTSNGTTLNVPVNLVISSGGTTPTGGNVGVSASTMNFSAVSGAASPATQSLTVSSAAGSASVPFTVAAASTGNWLSVTPASGTTQANLSVAVNQANLTAGNYTGTITITPTGGSAVTVTVFLTVVTEPTFSVNSTLLTFAYQAGSGNTVSPGQFTVIASGGTAAFTVSTSSNGNWLSVTPTSGSTATSTTLSVQVTPGSLAASSTPYAGTITITGANGTVGTATVNVALNVTNPLPIVSAVLNAASFGGGPIAPGEIVSIFGTQIGPTTPATLTLTSAGKVSTSIGGVTVSFSGYLAPLIYVGATQINAVVPYELSGNKSPFVEVTFAGQKSNEPSLQLTTSAPGIFTANGSGSGPGAILNADGSVNSAANPATAGTPIVIYMTGEGLTTPAGVTGGVTTVNTSGTGPLTPAPQLAVSVMIGSQPAQVLFAGEAPGMVTGVMQVNATVPSTARTGANSVTVQVGKNISPSGVTVYVR
jgi:uncharacterized protein (TIGR03437 family)